jgi:hypothetical protein
MKAAGRLFASEGRLPMAKVENGHIVETATEARAGERGPTVRNVLVVSTTAVVVLFAIVYIYFFAG